MTDARALTRVQQDLAGGNPRAAVRRLRAMLASDPCNLTIYSMLTKIYRSAGDLAETGRWGYLTGEASESEIRAFEHAHPQPWIRLQLLGWPASPDRLPNPEARSRLAVLQKRVTEATIPLQRSKEHDLVLPQQRTASQVTETGHPALPSRTPGTNLPGARVPAPQLPASPLPLSHLPAQPVRSTRVPVSERPQANQVPANPLLANQFAAQQVPASQRALNQLTGNQLAGTQLPANRLPASRLPVRRPRPVRTRSIGASVRNYLILLFLIFGGMAGSVITIAGMRALFGVKNPADPVVTLVKTVLKTIFT